jgi:hypothetical protein
MVEPAIGITAAAIATLRPLFINFLSFSRKHFEGPNSYSTTTLSTAYTKESRPSASSRAGSNGIGLGPYGYSNEFAEMLGLSRYGVTTTVTAGKAETRSERRKRERLEKEQEKLRRVGDCESQTELRDVEGKCEEDVSGYGFGWDVGIKATTTVVIDG